MQGLPDSLIRTESGGNFRAQNSVAGSGGRGHFGRGQFSRGRLQDAMRAGIIPHGTTPEQFMANPAMQEMVERWHTQDIMQRAESAGLLRHVGRQINGITVTPEGILSVAHLGGFDGMRRFLESDGGYNPSDAFGTSLADYLRTHGEAARQGQRTQQAARGGGNALSMGEQPPPGQMPTSEPQNALAMAREQEAIRQQNALAMLDRAQARPLDVPQMEMRPVSFEPMRYRAADTQAEFRPRSVRRTS